MQDIKIQMYDRLRNDVALRTLLGASIADPRIYHYKRPESTQAGTKIILYQEIPSAGRIRERSIADEAYQFTIEASDADDCDSIFERMHALLQNYNFVKNNTGCHRIRLDFKQGTILLQDETTWQLVTRYVVVLERFD